MYFHALTNKMVPDANSLSIEELTEVATSQNNVEYRLNYNKKNSLLQVALHCVTVTNCPNDQFMNPLLPLYM